MKEYIETVLAPRIQADGGWVEFVSREGEKLRRDRRPAKEALFLG